MIVGILKAVNKGQDSEAPPGPTHWQTPMIRKGIDTLPIKCCHGNPLSLLMIPSRYKSVKRRTKMQNKNMKKNYRQNSYSGYPSLAALKLLECNEIQLEIITIHNDLKR